MGKPSTAWRPDPNIVIEYAALMQTGAVFPPVTVWWDGRHYWLLDGFQRIAAAERAGLSHLAAEIRKGSLQDAQWDSYAANAVHGLRRTSAETKAVVQLALEHSKSRNLSTLQLAKHLHVPEATVRYWRSKLSSQSYEDNVRVVTRGQTQYALHIGKIGRTRRTGERKTRGEIDSDFDEMKRGASPDATRLLNILGNWMLGRSDARECLKAIEIAIQE